ncbi:MAG: SDR family oxidoreductase [Deltaproteobacteria bacterium]|nr:SDR family oxidoreductase [Deltaproteobacteria bacterium]
MHGKTCVITGSNSGIGKSTALELARRGAHVVMVCRSPERGAAAQAEIRRDSGSDRVDLLIADLGRLATVRAVAQEIGQRYERLDVLINNAGVYMATRELSPDGFEATLSSNHLGHFELTRLLEPMLRADGGARVIHVSSLGHLMGRIPFDDLQAERGYWGIRTYCNWKLANILFSNELARRWAGSGVTSNALHPGAVASNFSQNNGDWFAGLVRLGRAFLISPERGARTSVHLACAPEVDGVTGRYFQRSRPAKPSRRARSVEDAGRLWELSEELAASVA